MIKRKAGICQRGSSRWSPLTPLEMIIHVSKRLYIASYACIWWWIPIKSKLTVLTHIVASSSQWPVDLMVKAPIKASNMLEVLELTNVWMDKDEGEWKTCYLTGYMHLWLLYVSRAAWNSNGLHCITLQPLWSFSPPLSNPLWEIATNVHWFHFIDQSDCKMTVCYHG